MRAKRDNVCVRDGSMYSDNRLDLMFRRFDWIQRVRCSCGEQKTAQTENGISRARTSFTIENCKDITIECDFSGNN